MHSLSEDHEVDDIRITWTMEMEKHLIYLYSKASLEAGDMESEKA